MNSLIDLADINTDMVMNSHKFVTHDLAEAL